MIDELKDVLLKAAKVAQKALPKGVSVSLSDINPEAVKWAQKRAGDLVAKNIIAESQAAISSLITKSFTSGVDVKQTARLIREYVGLPPTHSNAVESYRQEVIDKLVSGGWVPKLAEDEAARLATKYAEQLINYRAENIARTETITASSEGQRELWRQGVKDGELVKEDWERVWIAADDERLCPVCAELDGKTAPFPDGNYDSSEGELLGPPAHCSCRCTEGLQEAGNQSHAVTEKFTKSYMLIGREGVICALGNCCDLHQIEMDMPDLFRMRTTRDRYLLAATLQAAGRVDAASAVMRSGDSVFGVCDESEIVAPTVQ